MNILFYIFLPSVGVFLVGMLWFSYIASRESYSNHCNRANGFESNSSTRSFSVSHNVLYDVSYSEALEYNAYQRGVIMSSEHASRTAVIAGSRSPIVDQSSMMAQKAFSPYDIEIEEVESRVEEFCPKWTGDRTEEPQRVYTYARNR